MTGAEAKEALQEYKPVVCNGIVFRQMDNIIYHACAGGIDVTAELTDKTGRSTLTASIRNISLADPDAPVPPPPDIPLESITLHTCIGDYRVDMRRVEGGFTATENGIYAMHGDDSPFSVEEDPQDVLQIVTGRVRDVLSWVMAEWLRIHGLDPYPTAPETKE